MLPLQRRRKLVIEELADETLVYDQSRHKAHCLNRTASLVWKHCDGQTTPVQIAAMLREELGTQVSVDVVAAAVADLERARLLEAGPALARRVSRRHAAGKMAVAGLAAVVATITAPVAAQAASVGDCCSVVNQCRGGLNCVGTGHPECARCPGGKCCA